MSDNNRGQKKPYKKKTVWTRTQAPANSPGIQQPDDGAVHSTSERTESSTGTSESPEKPGAVHSTSERTESSTGTSESPEKPDTTDSTEEKTVSSTGLITTVIESEIGKVYVTKRTTPLSNIVTNVTQDQIAKSNLNPCADEFCPSNNYVPKPVDPLKEEEAFIKDFRQTIKFFYGTISTNPAQFNVLIAAMDPLIEPYIKRTGSIRIMVNEIFKLTLADSKFAFFSVKLAIHLMNLELTPGKHSFRDVMLDEAFERVCLLLENLNNPEAQVMEVTPTLMLISELYLQLEVGGNRLALLGDAVIDICKAMMNADHLPIEKKLTDIVFALKLTGRFLDQDSPVNLNTLMGPLWIYADKRRDIIGEKVFALVDNISELRYTHKWNPPSLHTNKESDAEETLEVSAGESDLQEVFYGPDGQIMSLEEQLFLDCNIDDSSPDQRSQESPSGMDSEMESAYDEFLASAGLNEDPNPRSDS